MGSLFNTYKHRRVIEIGARVRQLDIRSEWVDPSSMVTSAILEILSSEWVIDMVSVEGRRIEIVQRRYHACMTVY